MIMLMSLIGLYLLGVAVSHPGLHMAMHTIAYEAVTVLCAVEPAVEKSCCIAAVEGNTAATHAHGGVAVL